MGGLIGKLSFERDETLAHSALEQMLEAVRHRGGDSRGLHTAPGIALGSRGDVARTISNGRESIVAVADATLTNRDDLRARLARAGHLVAGADDAALIAHAYKEWGDRLVDHLRGPYALAVWDGAARRLLLARDHSGVRPLFYAVLHGHGLVFGSAIRALLVDPGVGREWCPVALDAYLAHGYVPAPLTPYRRISKLEPGHRLLVDGRRFHIECFEQPVGPRCGSVASALRSAVGAHAGDAGVLFSGGTASTALLEAATGDALQRRAIIVGLDQDTRELAQAYAYAERLGAEPLVEIAARDFGALAADVASVVEEPHADPGLVAHYAVCLAARRHVTRAMTGHGAQALWSQRRPDPGPWTEADRFGVYTRRFAHEVAEALPPAAGEEPAGLSSDSLTAVATLGLDAGIELHFPHVDPRLVAFAHGGQANDHPFRSEVAPPSSDVRLTPDGVHGVLHQPDATTRQRRRARHRWLRDAVRTMVPWLLLTGRFDGRGIVSPIAVRRLWEDHRRGRHDHTRRFWSLLMLELWFREFVDGGVMEAPVALALARAA